MWLHSNGKAVGGGAESIVQSLAHTHTLGGPSGSHTLIYWLASLMKGHFPGWDSATGPSAPQRLPPDSHIPGVAASVVMAACVNVCSGVFLACV